MKLLTFFVKWNNISITRPSLFHDSWLGYRLVTCHEMKLKTREEMMSFHSTKWWNNSRLVMKYHFIPQKMSAIVHFLQVVHCFCSCVSFSIQCDQPNEFSNCETTFWGNSRTKSRFSSMYIINIFWKSELNV